MPWRPLASREMSSKLLLLPVLAVALLAAGCGGSDDETSGASDWANSVCSAVSTWKTSVSSAATSIQGGNLSENSLESAVDDVTDATKTLADDLKDAGTPDTADGQKAKGVVDQLAGEIEDGAREDRRRRRRRLERPARGDLDDHRNPRHDGRSGRRRRRPAGAARTGRRVEGCAEQLRRVLEPPLRRMSLVWPILVVPPPPGSPSARCCSSAAGRRRAATSPTATALQASSA